MRPGLFTTRRAPRRDKIIQLRGGNAFVQQYDPPRISDRKVQEKGWYKDLIAQLDANPDMSVQDIPARRRRTLRRAGLL